MTRGKYLQAQNSKGQWGVKLKNNAVFRKQMENVRKSQAHESRVTPNQGPVNIISI
jgi:hypothetical protein